MPTANLPQGLQASATQCGIRRSKSRLDLALLLADQDYPAAAVYTKSLLLGAHIPVAREHLAATGGKLRAVLVNSGNANCSTGQRGIEDNRRVCEALAKQLGCATEEVLFLSTGVIGAHLPLDLILGSLPNLTGPSGQPGVQAFAQGIMTTDLVPKLVVHDATEPATGAPFRVTGIGKGSGMIHPDMATMFGFLLTDAPLGSDPHALLTRINGRSFQRLSVDGDTSPNDTVLLWGTGRAAEADPALLEQHLTAASRDIARRIATDGEGATRLITIRITGAPTEAEAAHVARVVATSPLVKTAVHGRDPNWGRLLAAAARAGVAFDPEQAIVRIGPATVYEAGTPLPDNEQAAHLHMLQDKEVVATIHLAAGTAEAECWTCDFSADYVRINADYRS